MRPTAPLLLALLALLPGSLPCPAAVAQVAVVQPVAANPKGEALLARVAVIGASVSSGYGLGKDAQGKRFDLARVVEASLLGPHDAPLAASSSLTFGDPQGASRRTLGKLTEYKPTLVVALDYLFWFGYGVGWAGEAERLAALEQGLATLGDLHCTILLGDFPDMRSALEAKAPVLPAQAVPSPEILGKLNRRVAEFATLHPNVIVVPVSKLMGSLLAGEELRAGPNLWTRVTARQLLQDDGLHTTLEGTVGLWLFAVDRLLEVRKDVPRTALESEARALLAKVDPAQGVLAVPDPAQAKAKAKTKPGAGSSGKK